MRISAMARQLLLVRHGPIDDCYDQRYIGRTDVPVRVDWSAQAAGLAGFLDAHPSAKCYCSPQLRARQTLATVAPAQVQPALDDDLREIDFGRWEGQTWDEVSAAEPVATSAWWEFHPDFAFPGGDSMADFAARTRRAADRMAADPAEVVLAVTHGGPIRMLICHLLGLPIQKGLLFNPRRGTCAVVEQFLGKWVLAGLNLPAGAEGT